jgi:hypothetical protein
LIFLVIEAVCVNVINLSNLHFQGPQVNFSSYKVSLEKTILELEKQRDMNGPVAFLQQQLNTTPLGNFYHFKDKDWETMGKKTALFVNIIIGALESRFPELKELCGFDVFDPRNRENVKNWGVPKIKRLFRTFLLRRETEWTEDDAGHEWGIWLKTLTEILTEFAEAHPDDGKELDAVGVMQMLLAQKGRFSLLPILRELSAIALTLSFSTAIVESTFSLMKIIKNYRINAMSQELLDDILNICLNGPREMPLEKSIQLAKIWLYGSGHRHFRQDKSMQTPWGQ